MYYRGCRPTPQPPVFVDSYITFNEYDFDSSFPDITLNYNNGAYMDNEDWNYTSREATCNDAISTSGTTFTGTTLYTSDELNNIPSNYTIPGIPVHFSVWIRVSAFPNYRTINYGSGLYTNGGTFFKYATNPPYHPTPNAFSFGLTYDGKPIISAIAGPFWLIADSAITLNTWTNIQGYSKQEPANTLYKIWIDGTPAGSKSTSGGKPFGPWDNVYYVNKDKWDFDINNLAMVRDRVTDIDDVLDLYNNT